MASHWASGVKNQSACVKLALRRSVFAFDFDVRNVGHRQIIGKAGFAATFTLNSGKCQYIVDKFGKFISGSINRGHGRALRMVHRQFFGVFLRVGHVINQKLSSTSRTEPIHYGPDACALAIDSMTERTIEFLIKQFSCAA